MKDVLKVRLRPVILILLVIGAFGVSARAQTCVSQGTYCPGRGWVITACDAPNPCGYSTGSSSSGSTNGGLLGVLFCSVFGGAGCPEKVDRKKEAAVELNRKGNTAYEQGLWADAIAYYEEALRKSPYDKIIRDNLAGARTQLQYQRSREKRAAALAENDKGLSAFNKGDWAAAASYFRQALRNNPDDPVIKQNLANARAQLAIAAEAEAVIHRKENKAAVGRINTLKDSFIQTLMPPFAVESDLKDAVADKPVGDKGVPLTRFDQNKAPADDLGERPPKPVDPAKKAIDQANTANVNSKAAIPGGDPAKAMMQFDTAANKEASTLVIVASPTATLAGGLPNIPKDLENDPNMGPRVAGYKKDWEDGKTAKAEAQKKLDAIKELKAKPGANLGDLLVKEGNAINELKTAENKVAAAVINTVDAVRSYTRKRQDDKPAVANPIDGPIIKPGDKN